MPVHLYASDSATPRRLWRFDTADLSNSVGVYGVVGSFPALVTSVDGMTSHDGMLLAVTNLGLWNTNPLDPLDETGAFGLIGAFPDTTNSISGIASIDGGLYIAVRGPAFFTAGASLWRINIDNTTDITGIYGNRGTLPSGLLHPSGLTTEGGTLVCTDQEVSMQGDIPQDTIWRIDHNNPPSTAGQYGRIGTLPFSNPVIPERGILFSGAVVNHLDNIYVADAQFSPESSQLWRINIAIPSDVSALYSPVGNFPDGFGTSGGLASHDTIFNTPPTVSIETQPQIVGSRASIQLQATATDDDGTIVAYAWTGAGTFTPDNIEDPSWEAPQGGDENTDYELTLTVTDNAGATATATVTMTVEADPSIPTVDQTVDLETSLFLDASVSVYAPGQLTFLNPDLIVGGLTDVYISTCNLRPSGLISIDLASDTDPTATFRSPVEQHATFTFTLSTGESVQVVGPDAEAVANRDAIEPYAWIPPNVADVTAFFNAITQSATLSLRIQVGSVDVELALALNLNAIQVAADLTVVSQAIADLALALNLQPIQIAADLSVDPLITLAHFDATGLIVDWAAILVASDDLTLYADADRGGTDLPIEGELGLGITETIISRIRYRTDDSRLTLSDNDNPETLDIGAYFSSGGPGSDLRIYFQTTPTNVQSLSVADDILTSGGSFVHFNIPVAMRPLLNSIVTGVRFIFVGARLAPVAPDVSLELALDLNAIQVVADLSSEQQVINELALELDLNAIQVAADLTVTPQVIVDLATSIDLRPAQIAADLVVTQPSPIVPTELSGRMLPGQNPNREIQINTSVREIPRLATKVAGAFPVFCPSKRILLGSKIYPFASLDYVGNFTLREVIWRRRREETSVFDAPTTITDATIGNFTDILAATRFTAQTIDEFGSYIYELTLTNEFGHRSRINIGVVCDVVPGSNKNVQRNITFRPFADFMVAANPTRIQSIEYAISGDILQAHTAISRLILFSGTHEIDPGASYVYDGRKDYNLVDIALGTDILYNVVDGCSGIIRNIANNGHRLNVNALSGGINNVFNVGNTYQVLDGRNLEDVTRLFEMHIEDNISALINLRVTDLDNNVSETSILVSCD